MSRCSSLNHLKAYASAALALLSFASAGSVHAQTAVTFSDLDWTMDRGNRDFKGTAATQNGTPARLGANNIYTPGNNPGSAVRRWTFPLSRDLYGFGNATALPIYSIIDNPNINDPLAPDLTGQSRYLPYLPLSNGLPEAGPGYINPATAGGLPGFAGIPKPHTVFTNGTTRSWVLPLPDFRVGGYSRQSNPTLSYNFDYDYVLAQHDDFPIVRDTSGQTTPLLTTEATSFPNVAANIYRGVHQRLVSSTAKEPYAQWSSGQLQPGRYAVELFSPGNGTNLGTLGTPSPRPNTNRVFVRVSWKGTVDLAGNYVFGSGAAGAGGINDPANSRIYSIDLGQPGWIQLSGTTGIAGFPYNGTAVDQLVVTQYTLTSDNLSEYFNPPVITADAVRFTALLLPGSAGLGPVGTEGGYVSASGRILGPAVSSSNIVTGLGGLNPLFYFAREEYTADSTKHLFDPGDDFSGTIPDPVSLAVVPVFYCVDNQNGNVLTSMLPSVLINTKNKVRWRYVGAPFNNASPGTSVASPVLANVRCRDGNVRSMVYFSTTTSDGSLGRVYALDPAGDQVRGVTTAYWAYPSIRPLIGNEGLGTKTSVQGEFQDPNYTLTGFTRSGYPTPSFGVDKAASLDGAYYYDGDIVNVGGVATVRTDTRLTTDREVRNGGGGTLGGIQASPLIVDDPSDPNGANLLIVPSMNGRVYAFDAGGRGDFGTLAPVVNASGTTQRIWTWPHLGVDGFRHPPIIQTQVNTLIGEPDKLAFPSTPSMDTSAGTSGPIFLGGGDASRTDGGVGYLYSLNLGRDVFSGIVSGSAIFAERRAWQYPSATATLSLKAPPSIAAVYNLEGTRSTPLIYFTAGGRVYSIDPATLIAPLGQIPTPNLQWVYPYTGNVPDQEAGNDATVALDPGFLGNAPLLQRALWTDGTQKYLCTVVTSAGRILTLDPLGVGAQRTTVFASTQSFNSSTVRTSPIATLLTGQVGTDTSPNRPAFIFGDDSGSILGYATSPDAIDGVDPVTNLPFNRLLWQYGHPAANSAGTILSNSIVGVGDEGGIFHAYGVGIGAGGIGETIGENPPGPRDNTPLSQGDGTVTIDIRSFDVYTETDYDLMMTAGGEATPGHTVTGARFGKTREPAPGDFGGSNAIIREWGDGLYAVAWGVYHALPQDKNLPLFGTAPPQVKVTFTVTGQGTTNGVSIPAGQITVPAYLRRPDGTTWPADLGLSLAEMDTLKIMGRTLPSSPEIQFQGTTEDVYPWVAKIPLTNTNGFRIDARFNPGASYSIRAVADISQGFDTINGTGGGTKNGTSSSLSIGQRDHVGKTDSLTQVSTNNITKLGSERPFFVAHPFAVSVRGATPFSTNGPNIIGWFGDLSSGLTDRQKAEVLGNGNDLSQPDSRGGVINLGTKVLFAPLGMVQDGQSKGYTVLGGASGTDISPGLYVVDRSKLIRTGVFVKVKATVVSAKWLGRTSSVMNPLPWEQFPTETESTPDYPALSSEAFSLTSGGKSVTETGINLNAPTGVFTNNRALSATQIDLSVKVPKFQPANVNFGVWTDSKRGTYGAGFPAADGTVRGNGAKAGAMFGPLVIATGDVTNNRDYLYPSGGYLSNIRIESETSSSNNGNRNFSALYGVKGTPYRFMDMGVAVPPTVRMKMGVDTIDLGKLSHSAGYSDLVEKSNDFRSPFAPFNLGAGFDPTLPVPTKEDYWSSYFRPFTLISESNINLVRVRIAKLFGPNNSTIGVGSLTNFPGANVAAALQVKATSNDDTTLLPIFGIGIAQPGLRNIGIVSSFDHPSLNSNNYNETNLWEKVLNPFVTNAGISNAGLPLVDRPATGELGWGNQKQRQPTVHKPRIGDNAGTVASIPDIPYNSSLALQFPGGFKTELPKISVAIPLGTPSGEYKSKIIAYEDNTPFQWRNWLLISKNLNTDPTNPGADADGILNSYSNDPAKFSDFALEAFTDPGMTLKVQVVETRLTNNAGKGSLAQMDPLLDPNLTQFPSANLMPTVVTSLGVPEKGVSYNGVSMFWPTNRGTKNGEGVNALTPWSLAFSWLSTSATELRANGNSPVQIGEARFVVPGSDAQPQGAHWWAIPTPYVDLTNTTLLQTLFPSNVVEATATGSLYLQGNRNPATARATSPAATRLEEIGNLYSTEGVLFWQGQIVKTDGIRQVTDSRTFYTKLGLTKLGAAGGSLAPVGVTQSFLNDPALTKQNPKPLYVMLPAANGNPKQAVTFLFWQAGNRSKSQLYYNANATADLAPNAWSKDTILPTPAALSFLSEPTAVLRKTFNADGNLVDAVEVAYSGQIKNRSSVEILLSRFEIVRAISANGKTEVTLKPMLLPNSFREPTVTKPGVVGTYIARDAAWILDNKPENKILVQASDGRGGFNLLNPGNGKFEEGTGLVYFDSTVGGQIVVDTRAGSVSFPNIAPPRGTTIYVTYTPQVARLNVSRNESNFDVFTNNNGGFSLLEPSLNRQPAGNIIGDNTNPTMIIDRTPNRRNRLSAPSVVFAPNGTAVSPLAGDAFIPSLARRWLLYRKAAPTGTLSGIYYKTQRVVIQLPRSVRVNYNANGSSFVALSILNGVQGSGYEVDWSRGRVYFDEQMDGQKVTIIFTDSTGTTHQGMTYIAKWGDETNSSSGGTTEALMPIDTSVSEGQVTAYKDPFVDKLWVYWTSTRNGVSDLYYQTIAPQFYPNQP